MKNLLFILLLLASTGCNKEPEMKCWTCVSVSYYKNWDCHPNSPQPETEIVVFNYCAYEKPAEYVEVIVADNDTCQKILIIERDCQPIP